MTRASPDTAEPDLADVLAAAVATSLGRVRVAIPAHVVAFDAPTQTITAQIVIRARYVDADGVVSTYLPAPIARVPVAFPSGAGASITWPLTPGDPVILLVSDRSISEWKETAAADNVPIDVRRFDWSDSIALPGCRSPGDPLTGDGMIDAIGDGTGLVITPPPGGAVLLGGGGASDPVAVAPAVESYLAALVSSVNALITAYNAHTHVASSFGAPTTTPVAPAGSATAPTAGEFDAVGVRVTS